MARAQVDAETLERLMQLLGYEEQLLGALSADLYREYDAAGAGWNDRAYEQLGTVIQNCVERCKHASVDLAQVRERLGRLLVVVRRYEETSVDGGDAGGPSGVGGSAASAAVGAAGGAVGAAAIAAAAYQGAVAGAAVGSAGGSGSNGGGAAPRNTIESISGWITTINPNYNNPFTPKANVNCGSCAFAVEARLSGKPNSTAGMENIPTPLKMEEATGKRCISTNPGGIASRLMQQGPGSHMIVGITRTRNGMPISGHWFNVFYDGNAIYTIDGQSGQIHGFPHDYHHVSGWIAMV